MTARRASAKEPRYLRVKRPPFGPAAVEPPEQDDITFCKACGFVVSRSHEHHDPSPAASVEGSDRG